ncbi:MAG: hypothetical protein ACJ79J_04935 [Gemmatimonadaceae bacterium]
MAPGASLNIHDDGVAAEGAGIAGIGVGALACGVEEAQPTSNRIKAG